MPDSPAGSGGTADAVTAEEARKNWADLLSRAQYGGEHISITRNGKRAALVVPPDWYDEAVTALAAHEDDPTKRA